MKNILFYPYYSNMNEYVNISVSLLKKRYRVFDYCFFRDNKIYDDIDVIVLNWIESTLSEADIDYISQMKKNGTLIIWTFHNKVPHDIKDNNELDKAISRIRRVLELTDVVLIHAHKSIELLRLYGLSDRVKVVYVPHVNYENVYGNYAGDLRAHFGIDDTKVVIGFLGQIKPYKNIEILIDAFKKANKNDAVLIIAGRCWDKDYYEELLERIGGSNSILFKEGIISDAAMGSWLEAVDVLALPYNVKSSMNSGSMIMAFSYSRTVVVPPIEMAYDFPDDLIYTCGDLNLTDETVIDFSRVLRNVIDEGRDGLKEKGKIAGDIVKRDNCLTTVAKTIYSVIESNTGKESRDDRIVCYNDVGKIKGSNPGFLFDVAYNMLRINRGGSSIAGFLTEFGFNSVAIYGMGKIGHLLYDELVDNGINVDYCIDRRPIIYRDAKLYSPKDDLPDTELIIITVSDIETVKESLSGFSNIKLMGIAEILNCILVGGRTFSENRCYSLTYDL